MAIKKFKNCKKGYACGAGCIHVKYICNKEFPEGVSVPLNHVAGQVKKVIHKRKISDVGEEKSLKDKAKELAAKKAMAAKEAEAKAKKQATEAEAKAKKLEEEAKAKKAKEEAAKAKKLEEEAKAKKKEAEDKAKKAKEEKAKAKKLEEEAKAKKAKEDEAFDKQREEYKATVDKANALVDLRNFKDARKQMDDLEASVKKNNDLSADDKKRVLEAIKSAKANIDKIEGSAPKPTPKPTSTSTKETEAVPKGTKALDEGLIKALDTYMPPAKAIQTEFDAHNLKGDWNNEDDLNFIVNSRVGKLKEKLEIVKKKGKLKSDELKDLEDEVTSLENSAKVRLHIMNPDKYPNPGDSVLDGPIMPVATKGLARRMIDKTKEKYPDFESAMASIEGNKSNVKRSFRIDKKVKEDSEKATSDRDFTRKVAKEFDDMTNGQTKAFPQKISKDTDRAYADYGSGPVGDSGFFNNSALNVGRQTSKANTKYVMYHELGHFLEKSDPKVRKLAYSMREEQATSNKLEKVSKLTGDKRYGDDELAYPTKAYDPYVARKYSLNTQESFRPHETWDSTEVTSMAMQNFSNRTHAEMLYKTDPELFYYGLSIINQEPVL